MFAPSKGGTPMEEVISRAKACGEGEDGERCEKVRGALPPDEVR